MRPGDISNTRMFYRSRDSMFYRSRDSTVMRALTCHQVYFRPGTIYGLLLFVAFPWGFFFGNSVFYPLPKSHISKLQFRQDRGPAWKPAMAGVASSLNIVDSFILYLIFLFVKLSWRFSIWCTPMLVLHFRPAKEKRWTKTITLDYQTQLISCWVNQMKDYKFTSRKGWLH